MSRPRSSESVFRAIADPTRRRMLDLLCDRECTVGEIVETMRLRRAVATFHLAVLLKAGLVLQRRQARNLMCTPDCRPLIPAHAWLSRRLPASARPTAQRTTPNARP
jgi:DNA-binding transcriptional ArsR family regulator